MSSAHASVEEVENLAVAHEEERTQEIPANMSMAHVDEKFTVPGHLSKNVITRHYILQWDNSLAGLAAVPENATWKPLDDHLDIFKSTTRWGPNCHKSAVRQGNLNQAIMVGMKVKKVTSNFPCQLGLKINGAKGNYYTCNGERYAYLIGAGEETQNLDEIVVTTNPYVNSEYLRLYPGMTSKKLREEGIMQVPGENYVFVDRQHPIVEMMSENQDVLQIDLGGADLIDNRWYKVSKTITERCLSELENELVTNLPMLNLNNFSASIHRLYGRQWDSEDEVCDNVVQPELKSRVMTANRRATAIIQLTYAFC